MRNSIFGDTHPAVPASRDSRKTLDAVTLALVYALFVVLFPWDLVSRGGFPDFESYVEDFNYFSAAGVAKRDLYEISTLGEYVVSEVLWHEAVRFLTDITGEAAIALRMVSFFILFVWAFVLFRRVHYGVALLFLFNPTAIDVAMSGIRNGLGWSFAIIAIGVRSRAVQAALFLTGVFIHTTTLVVAVLYYFTEFTLRILKRKAVLISGVGAGVFVGLALTIASQLVLGTLGDRRTGEDYLVGGGSILQASIWGILLFFQCLSGSDYIRRNSFVIAILAWYLTMVPFVPWSFRVWGCLLPLIAVSAIELSPRKRQLFLFLYSGYLMLQYLFWSKLFEHWYVT